MWACATPQVQSWCRAPASRHGHTLRIPVYGRRLTRVVAVFLAYAGAELVLSSSWREFDYSRERLAAALQAYGLGFKRWTTTAGTDRATQVCDGGGGRGHTGPRRASSHATCYGMCAPRGEKYGSPRRGLIGPHRWQGNAQFVSGMVALFSAYVCGRWA